MSETIEIDVRNPTGLHARPAAVFVRAAAAFRADVWVSNLSTASPEVNAKSILAVLGLGASPGHRISLRASGDDEAEAVRVLRDLVADGLGDDVGRGVGGGAG